MSNVLMSHRSLALFDGSGNVLNSYVIFLGRCRQAYRSTRPEGSVDLAGPQDKAFKSSRASNRRYTSVDQGLYYPGDTAFNWVESLNDQALKWTP